MEAKRFIARRDIKKGVSLERKIVAFSPFFLSIHPLLFPSFFSVGAIKTLVHRNFKPRPSLPSSKVREKGKVTSSPSFV